MVIAQASAPVSTFNVISWWSLPFTVTYIFSVCVLKLCSKFSRDMSLFVEVTVSRKTLIGSVRSFLLHCCQEHCKALRYYHHYLSICPGLGNLDC